MKKSNSDIVRKKFSPHQFDITCNKDGYNAFEILIDDQCSGIWINDYMIWCGNEKWIWSTW